MDWILALTIGALFAAGIAALRRATRLHLVAGIVLLSQAVNLAVFTAGNTVIGAPALVDGGTAPGAEVADPLPQALVLTAIVIGLGVLAYLLALLVRNPRMSG